MSSEIIGWVDNALNRLRTEFEAAPSMFFTENDIVCYFYNILMERRGLFQTQDAQGKEHLLIHTEYPTPFRCDMSGHGFEIKNDDDRTEGGGFYKRGHYDIAILNPEIMANHTYEEIKGQHFDVYKARVLRDRPESIPVIIYAIEFVYKRDRISWKGITSLRKQVTQDHEKLLQSKSPAKRAFEHLNGFLGKGRTAILIRLPACDRTIEELQSNFSREDFILCMGPSDL